MFCPNCGTRNDDGAVRCESCLTALPAAAGQAPVQQNEPMSYQPPVQSQPEAPVSQPFDAYAAPQAPAAPYSPPAESFTPPQAQYQAPAAPYSPPAESFTPPQGQYQAPAAPYSPPAESFTPPQGQPYQQPPVQNAPYGQPQGQPFVANAQPGGTPPPNFLVGNIIVTVLSSCSSCLGLILGIIGIVFSSKVKKTFEAGDIEGSLKASKTAKMMFIIGLILLILGAIITIIVFASLAAAGGGDLAYALEDMLYEFGIY